MSFLLSSALPIRGRIPRHVWLFDLYTISRDLLALFSRRVHFSRSRLTTLLSLRFYATNWQCRASIFPHPYSESVVRPDGTLSFVGGHVLLAFALLPAYHISWAAGGCWGDQIGKKGVWLVAVSIFYFLLLGLNDDEERRGLGGGDYDNWISARLFPRSLGSLLVWPGSLQCSFHININIINNNKQHCKRRRINTWVVGWQAGWVFGMAVCVPMEPFFQRHISFVA